MLPIGQPKIGRIPGWIAGWHPETLTWKLLMILSERNPSVGSFLCWFHVSSQRRSRKVETNIFYQNGALFNTFWINSLWTFRTWKHQWPYISGVFHMSREFHNQHTCVCWSLRLRTNRNQHWGCYGLQHLLTSVAGLVLDSERKDRWSLNKHTLHPHFLLFIQLESWLCLFASSTPLLWLTLTSHHTTSYNFTNTTLPANMILTIKPTNSPLELLIHSQNLSPLLHRQTRPQVFQTPKERSIPRRCRCTSPKSHPKRHRTRRRRPLRALGMTPSYCGWWFFTNPFEKHAACQIGSSSLG